MPRISQTQKTAPLRKAVVVRRALGVFALAGLFALPQTAQAQDRGPRGGDPEQRVAQGVGYVPQGRDIFQLPTVRENLEIPG